MQDGTLAQAIRDRAAFDNSLARLMDQLSVFLSGGGGIIVLCGVIVLLVVWIVLPFMVWAQLDHLREIRDQSAWMASYLRAKEPGLKLPDPAVESDRRTRNFYLLMLALVLGGGAAVAMIL